MKIRKRVFLFTTLSLASVTADNSISLAYTKFTGIFFDNLITASGQDCLDTLTVQDIYTGITNTTKNKLCSITAQHVDGYGFVTGEIYIGDLDTNAQGAVFSINLPRKALLNVIDHACPIDTTNDTDLIDFKQLEINAIANSRLLSTYTPSLYLNTTNHLSRIAPTIEGYDVLTLNSCNNKGCGTLHPGQLSTAHHMLKGKGKWKGPKGLAFPSNLIINIPVTVDTKFTIKTKHPSEGITPCGTIYNFYPADNNGAYASGSFTLAHDHGGQLLGVTLAPEGIIIDAGESKMTGLTLGKNYVKNGNMNESLENHPPGNGFCAGFTACFPKESDTLVDYIPVVKGRRTRSSANSSRATTLSNSTTVIYGKRPKATGSVGVLTSTTSIASSVYISTSSSSSTNGKLIESTIRVSDSRRNTSSKKLRSDGASEPSAGSTSSKVTMSSSSRLGISSTSSSDGISRSASSSIDLKSNTNTNSSTSFAVTTSASVNGKRTKSTSRSTSTGISLTSKPSVNGKRTKSNGSYRTSVSTSSSNDKESKSISSSGSFRSSASTAGETSIATSTRGDKSTDKEVQPSSTNGSSVSNSTISRAKEPKSNSETSYSSVSVGDKKSESTKSSEISTSSSSIISDKGLKYSSNKASTSNSSTGKESKSAHSSTVYTRTDSVSHKRSRSVGVNATSNVSSSVINSESSNTSNNASSRSSSSGTTSASSYSSKSKRKSSRTSRSHLLQSSKGSSSTSIQSNTSSFSSTDNHSSMDYTSVTSKTTHSSVAASRSSTSNKLNHHTKLTNSTSTFDAFPSNRGKGKIFTSTTSSSRASRLNSSSISSGSSTSTCSSNCTSDTDYPSSPNCPHNRDNSIHKSSTADSSHFANHLMNEKEKAWSTQTDVICSSILETSSKVNPSLYPSSSSASSNSFKSSTDNTISSTFMSSSSSDTFYTHTTDLYDTPLPTSTIQYPLKSVTPTTVTVYVTSYYDDTCTYENHHGYHKHYEYDEHGNRVEVGQYNDREEPIYYKGRYYGDWGCIACRNEDAIYGAASNKKINLKLKYYDIDH